MVTDIEKIIFNCLRCGRCCGPHYVSSAEQKIIDEYLFAAGIEKRQHLSLYDKCPYFENNSCLIYPVRPLVCRLMGLTPLMPCPRGVAPSEFVPAEIAIEAIRELQNSEF